MNNRRLLAGLFCIALPSAGTCLHAQSVITLEAIYRIAETHSSQMRTSYAAEQETDRDIEVARTQRLPEISADLSLSFIGDGFTTKRNFSDYQNAPIPHFGNSLGISVTQPVYTGGAISKSIELSQLKSTASRFATDLCRNNLRMALTGWYLDIYKYRNLRSVVESNLDAARRVLTDMHARHQQGTVLLNDITRYELLVSNLEFEIVRIDNTLKILNDNLVTTAGLEAGSIVIPDTMMLAQAMETADLQTLRREADESSPRLRLARADVDISLKAEELARACRRPTIGLQAGWSLNGPILTEVPPINRNLSYWYVGVGVRYSLSSLFRNDKTEARSHAATITAQSRLESTSDYVSLAVSDAHIRWLESQVALNTRLKGVELAMRNYKTVSTRYDAGMALITDMLDAASARLEAEQQLVNARIDVIYNYYRLKFTTGKI